LRCSTNPEGPEQKKDDAERKKVDAKEHKDVVEE
jgi:hypothetical protein